MAFRHHASAAAFGGYMTAPFTEALTTQAASVLSPVGGYGSARVENYRYHQIVSFDVGYSQVIGTRRLDRKGNTVHETLSQAVVEGLNILDIVTADRVVSRLASEYVESEPPDEYRFRPIGSYFVNLRIAGCRIGDASGVLQPRGELLANVTSSTIVGNLVDKGTLTDLQGEKFQRVRRCNSLGKEIQPDYPHRLRLSLFDLPRFEAPGLAKLKGDVIDVPGFGTVTLGEFIVSPTDRHLTMIVVALHSPEEGELTVGPVEGNGSIPT
jgi:hypothetical protein